MLKRLSKVLWAAGLAASGGLTGSASQGAIVVTPSSDALAMASALAQQMGVTLVVNENLRYTGAANASGFFTGAAGVLPMESGVVMTTGSVLRVPGPNSSEGVVGGSGMPGDGALSELIEQRTFDAAVLEFDFIPGNSPVVSLRFVFGSEEYNEFALAPVKYDDVFAVFLNGQNIAVLPGLGLPISISNVNESLRAAYFTQNELSSGAPYDIEYDGMVGNSVGPRAALPLLAEGVVSPSGINHIRIAIADAGDPHLDSGVLIEAVVVPEPTGVVVAMMGAAGAAGWVGRRRRAS